MLMENNNIKTCTAAEYSSRLLLGLNSLLQEQLFCDISVQVEWQIFTAHRNVLSAASPYFQAMFHSGLKEAAMDMVSVNGITASAFDTLLQFMYTGKLQVSVDSIQEVIIAADMLQLSDVTDIGCHLLKQELCCDNCLGTYLFADRYNCESLKQSCESYINDNFSRLFHLDEFVRLPLETLIYFLRSDNLNIDNEYQVFSAAMNWIMWDIDSRMDFVADVLAPIRLPIISQRLLERFVDSCVDPLLKTTLGKVVENVRSESCGTLVMTKPFLFEPRQHSRKTLYVMGGYNRDKETRWSDIQTMATVDIFNTFHQFWKSAPPLLYARSGHGVTSMNGMIYVIGGERESLLFDVGERLDPSVNKWTLMPPMTVPRSGLGVCTCNNRIYAIGGWIGSEIGTTMETYDPNLDKWVVVDMIPSARFAMGVVEHQGLIYIIGGISEHGNELNTVESYNPVTREWTTLTHLCVRRAYVGVSCLDNHIYAVGGWNEGSEALQSVEKYSIEENTWTMVSPMNHARAGAAVAAANSQLYVIGGRTSYRGFAAPMTLSTVETYKPDVDQWSEVASMPLGRCEAGVAVV